MYTLRGRPAALRLISLSAIVAAVLACAPLPGQAARGREGTGIAGVVSVHAKATQRLASAGAYPGRRVTVGTDKHTSELANVVVFVKAAATPSPPRHAIIRQVDEQFAPHLVAITTGSTVDFPNDDLLFHNVFSLSRAATFDLGRFPRGKSKSRTFAEAGIVKVYCHLHSHMSAIVRVFDHPFFAIPEPDGRFTIPGLAPGRHEVVAWHERMGEVTTPIVVDAGQLAPVSFSLPLTDDEQ